MSWSGEYRAISSGDIAALQAAAIDTANRALARSIVSEHFADAGDPEPTPPPERDAPTTPPATRADTLPSRREP